MPRKTLEKPKEVVESDSDSSSSESTVEEQIIEKVIEEPKVVIKEPIKTNKKARKTTSDEELLKIKQENFAKAVAKSAEVRKQKKLEDLEKAKKEAEEKEKLFQKAKEDAYKEVYERLLVEQKIALKKEMNSKLKNTSKAQVKKTQKKQEVLESIGEEIKTPEPVAPVSKAPSSNVEKPKAKVVVNEPLDTIQKTIKLTNRQILSMYGF